MNCSDLSYFCCSLCRARRPGIGYLVYVRDSTLVAQPFDTGKLEFAGEAVPIADSVGRSANDAIAYFSVSQTGALTYRSGNEAGNQISWLDRDGKPLERVSEIGNYTEINLSPDMRSVVMASGGVARHDLYVLDLARKINTRFTFDAADDRSPVWSHDGKQVVFSSARQGRGDLYLKASSGATNEELLLKSSEPKTPNDWSNDGRFLLYTITDPKTRNDIWYLPMTGERKPKPFRRLPPKKVRASSPRMAASSFTFLTNLGTLVRSMSVRFPTASESGRSRKAEASIRAGDEMEKKFFTSPEGESWRWR